MKLLDEFKFVQGKPKDKRQIEGEQEEIKKRRIEIRKSSKHEILSQMFRAISELNQ